MLAFRLASPAVGALLAFSGLASATPAGTPALSISGAKVREGPARVAVVALGVKLARASAHRVRVGYAPSAGTAVAGLDFVAATGRSSSSAAGAPRRSALLGVRDERRASALPLAIRRMLWTPVNPPLPPPGEGDGLLGDFGIRLFARRRQPVVRLLAEEIEARRARGDRDGDDVIGRMLRAEPPLTTDAMIDELLGLLMPSNESGPAGLTWVLDRLAREPEMAEHFVSAGDDDVRRDAFVQEALRLRPAVHSVLRRLIAPMEIVGHRLQPGAVAMVPIMLVHRDPRAFPNPDAFRPERFLSDPVPDAPYIPFGGGARRCLGEPLARTAIDVVLPVVLRRWRLTPVSREPERMVVRGTVAAPQRGALAIAHPAPAP